LEEVSATSNSHAEQNRALKRRLEQNSSELERALQKAADLSDRLTTQEETLRSELSNQARLAELWERSCKETQDRNKDLEHQLEREQERTGEEVARWQVKAQQEEGRVEDAYSRIHELEQTVERLEAALEANAAPMSPVITNDRHSTPSRAQFSPQSVGSGVFSPSAQVLEKRGRGGMSLTQLYSELHSARQAEAMQRRRAERLQEEYDQYREEAERWAPEYQNTLQEFEQQKEDLAQMSLDLQNAMNEKENAERQLNRLKNTIQEKERETRLYQQRITYFLQRF